MGISGEGINTKYLLAGRIDVEQINIMNGSFPTFSWDKYGINAYSWQAENYINYGSFIFVMMNLVFMELETANMV